MGKPTKYVKMEWTHKKGAVCQDVTRKEGDGHQAHVILKPEDFGKIFVWDFGHLLVAMPWIMHQLDRYSMWTYEFGYVWDADIQVCMHVMQVSGCMISMHEKRHHQKYNTWWWQTQCLVSLKGYHLQPVPLHQLPSLSLLKILLNTGGWYTVKLLLWIAGGDGVGWEAEG